MNFRDLSRNCMARDKVLYDGHAVAAVAAISPAIAEEACELIEVEYHVLPHVIDVEEAMKPGAPLLHDDLFTQGVDPKPTHPSNVAKEIRFAKGDIDGRVPRRRRHHRAALYDQAGAPGLYRAACLRRVDGGGRPVHDLELEPGPVHGARLLRQIARHRHLPDPRDPGRDRRRVWRQDTGLSGAGGVGAGKEDRTPDQDGDEPRGGVPRHRADLGRGHRGQDRRQEGRPDRRRAAGAQIPGGRLPGLAGRAGLHVRLCDVRHPERRHRRLRRRLQPAQGRGLPRAGSADFVLRRRKLSRRTGARARRSTRCCCARRTPPRTAPRRCTGRPLSISAMPTPSTRPRTTRI